MSKLDEIKYEIYSASRPKHPDGTEMAITDSTRQQIKDLMLDLVGKNEPLPTDNKMLEHRVQSRNDLRAVQWQRIQEL